MSRLLFAAARGARLQVMADDNWYGISHIYMPFHRDARAIRVHPEDSELAYGPISSALREEAEAPAPDRYYYRSMSDELRYGFDFGSADGGIYWYDREADEMTRSLFLLILSEHFADEGM